MIDGLTENGLAADIAYVVMRLRGQVGHSHRRLPCDKMEDRKRRRG